MSRRFSFSVVGILFTCFAFFITTNPVQADDVTEPQPVTIRLRVETPASTLFDSDITVNPCIATSTQTTSTSGFCAVDQSSLGANWKWFDFGPMLETYGGFTGDWTNYWSWFSNLELGQTGLDSHPLSSGEHLLLVYGVNPLKITQSATSTQINATSTISVQGFGYDSNWSPIWSDQENFNLEIASTTFIVASSTYDFATSTAGIYAMRVTKSGFAPSEYYYIHVTEVPTEPSPTPSPVTVPPVAASFNIPLAITFLSSQQKFDGSFGADLYTDWAAIALSGNPGTSRENIKTYLSNNAFIGNSVTDYERHTMALMSLGINPYTANGENYIKKITDSFDGTQIGDTGLWNDDIFALFPLLKAGYTTDDDIIKKIVSFILSRQSNSGSFGNTDITAAAIQALSQVQTLPNVTPAITNAKNSLKSSQIQGGFGTSFATSWSMQAISSLGETNTSWDQGGENPITYLAKFQQTDGGIELNSSTPDNRVWATAYAIPATQGKTWFSLMSSFSKPTDTTSNQNTSSSNTNSTNSATTTTSIANTTPEAATTTVNAVAKNIEVKPLPRVLAFVEENIDSTTTEIPPSSELGTTSSTTTPSSNLAAVGVNQNQNNTLTFVLGAFGIIAILLGGYKWLRN